MSLRSYTLHLNQSWKALWRNFFLEWFFFLPFSTYHLTSKIKNFLLYSILAENSFHLGERITVKNYEKILEFDFKVVTNQGINQKRKFLLKLLFYKYKHYREMLRYWILMYDMIFIKPFYFIYFKSFGNAWRLDWWFKNFWCRQIRFVYPYQIIAEASVCLSVGSLIRFSMMRR